MNTVFIRADASEKIGAGHVMRCIAIAEQLAERESVKVYFLTNGKKAGQILKERGFSFFLLDSNGEQLEQEIPQLQNIVEKYAQGNIFLLVDSYAASPVFFEQCHQIKKVQQDGSILYLKTGYMDDLGKEKYPVDIIINYHIFSADIPYEKIYKGSCAVLLLGCDYVPLRKEFLKYRQYKKKQRIENNQKIEGNVKAKTQGRDAYIKKMLITLGGSDSLGIAPAIVEYLLQNTDFQELQLYIVVGAYSPQYPVLEKLKEKYKNIFLFSNVKNMAELISQCDIAVSAGGATLYELCACGVAGISISFADNQLPAVEAFDKRGLIPSAGDYRRGKESCLRRIAELVKKYMDEGNNLQEKKQIIEALVDAQGSKKVADVIEGLLQ